MTATAMNEFDSLTFFGRVQEMRGAHEDDNQGSGDDDDDDNDNDDDIYIMMKCLSVCLSVTKNHHFLLGVSCDHLNYP